MVKVPAACTVLAFLLVMSAFTSGAFAFMPKTGPIRIDCGSTVDSTDENGLKWSADNWFQGGTTSTTPKNNTAGGRVGKIDQSLRVWKMGQACYKVPVPSGRYLIRLGFVYNNFDGNYLNSIQQHSLPNLGIAIDDVFVEQISGEVTFGQDTTVHYTDYIAFAKNSDLSICLIPFKAFPFINSLQILPQDTVTYFEESTGAEIVLSQWRRINCGGIAFGPENHGDPGYRTWESDFAPTATDRFTLNDTAATIIIPDEYASMKLGQKLFQTSRKAGKPQKTTGYNFTGIFPVSTANNFMVVLYFAEIDKTVKVGDRVMDIWVNDKSVKGLDVLAKAGAAYTAQVVHLLDVPLKGDNENGYWLAVALMTHQGLASYLPPIISGVEIFEMIPSSLDVPRSDSEIIRIDCGSPANRTDDSKLNWSADYGFSSGNVSGLENTGSGLEVSKTLRYFTHPVENCYSVPVTPNRFLIRMYFTYGDQPGYDGKGQVPTFSVYLEDTKIQTITPASPGLFLSAYAKIDDGVADICLVGSTDQLYPFINSLEILQVEETAYNVVETSGSIIMYNYASISTGSDGMFGDGVDIGGEPAHRVWYSKNASFALLRCSNCNTVPKVSTVKIKNVNKSPNYWPEKLYEKLLEAPKGSSITYIFQIPNVTSEVRLAVYLHFVELNADIKKGMREMEVFANGQLVKLNGSTTVDIVAAVGVNTALDLHFYHLYQKQDGALNLTISPKKGSPNGPVLSGVEVFGLLNRSAGVPNDEYTAMHVLKSSLTIAEDMNWQGDPCAPITWQRVDCNADNNVVGIDISNLNISGTLPVGLANLGNLTTFNASGNYLTGPIPADMENLSSIVKIDLSHNQLSGSIPPSLAAIQSLQQLFLNDNQLNGSVPASLSSQSNTGLNFNISGNPSLCSDPAKCVASTPGTPPAVYVPSPSSGGKKSSSSIGVVVGVIIGVLVLAAVLAGAFFLWRKRSKASAESGSKTIPYSRSKNKAGQFESPRSGADV